MVARYVLLSSNFFLQCFHVSTVEIIPFLGEVSSKVHYFGFFCLFCVFCLFISLAFENEIVFLISFTVYFSNQFIFSMFKYTLVYRKTTDFMH